MKQPFVLETLVDFPDDALSCAFPLTPSHLDAMMATLAEQGIGRVIWGYYGDGHGGCLLPDGIDDDPSISFDQNQWGSYARTQKTLGNPLRVATEAAHRHGMELYAYYKPYETGPSMLFAEGSPQAAQWGRLPHIGGSLAWMDPFVAKHPHLRIQRRTDDLHPDVLTVPIHTLRLTKKDATPTRITAEHLQIWTSDHNYRYVRQPVRFAFAETVEPSASEVRDIYGNVLTRQDDPVRVLTLSGLDLRDRYFLVTTDFIDGPGDFENAWDRILSAFDANGQSVPGVYATGTAIWFPEWEDFREGGLCFDTGRGPEAVTLDLPNAASDDREKKGSNAHFVPGQKKVRGIVAFARGRNAYLPGALCETEPEVQAYWLACIREMLDAGVDGIEFREENHSTHTDTPGDYGFNPAVLARIPAGGRDLLADIARVRSDAYTEFLRRAKALIASRNRRMRVNLNVDWFRPAAERPNSRRLAYPANIEFEWKHWVTEGLMDEAMLRVFGKPFAVVFNEDAVAQDMIQTCRGRGIPVTVNRYVWGNPGLLDEFRRVCNDGRFDGFVLYETWAYLGFTAEGGCAIAGPGHVPTTRLAAEVRQTKIQTGAMILAVGHAWRAARSAIPPTSTGCGLTNKTLENS